MAQIAAIFQAVLRADAQMLCRFLDNGGQVNCQSADRGKTPLHLAAYLGYSDIVEILVDYGAEIDAGFIDEPGITPLYLAAGQGHLKIVKFLINCDAKFDLPTALDKETPLFIACVKGWYSVAKLLITVSADVNHADSQNFIPLHLVCQSGDDKLINLLIRTGSRINAQDYQGNTPLHYAVMEGFQGVCNKLILANANVNLNNIQDKMSPLLMAATMPDYRIVEILLSVQPDLSQFPFDIIFDEGVRTVFRKWAPYESRKFVPSTFWTREWSDLKEMRLPSENVGVDSDLSRLPANSQVWDAVMHYRQVEKKKEEKREGRRKKREEEKQNSESRKTKEKPQKQASRQKGQEGKKEKNKKKISSPDELLHHLARKADYGPSEVEEIIEKTQQGNFDTTSGDQYIPEEKRWKKSMRKIKEMFYTSDEEASSKLRERYRKVFIPDIAEKRKRMSKHSKGKEKLPSQEEGGDVFSHEDELSNEARPKQQGQARDSLDESSLNDSNSSDHRDHSSDHRDPELSVLEGNSKSKKKNRPTHQPNHQTQSQSNEQDEAPERKKTLDEVLREEGVDVDDPNFQNMKTRLMKHQGEELSSDVDYEERWKQAKEEYEDMFGSRGSSEEFEFSDKLASNWLYSDDEQEQEALFDSEEMIQQLNQARNFYQRHTVAVPPAPQPSHSDLEESYE